MDAMLKVWLEEDGQVVLSTGRALLLREIQRLGSITAAAKALGMSYRAAWGKVHECERSLGFRVLEARAGGRGGGGAVLTPQADEFLAKYERFLEESQNCVQDVFHEIFGGQTGENRAL